MALIGERQRLSTQIFVLQIVIILLTVVAGFAVSVAQARRVLDQRTGETSLAIARTIASMPDIVSGLTAPEPAYVIDPIADLSPAAREFAHDRRIFDALHDLYGEPACLFKEKLIYKPPGAEGATLHQDWIGWPGFPESFLTVVAAIDAFTADGGATEVFPRLHREGYRSPKDGWHHFLDADSLPTRPVLLELEPGDVAIFSCFTPHRSAPNASTIPVMAAMGSIQASTRTQSLPTSRGGLSAQRRSGSGSGPSPIANVPGSRPRFSTMARPSASSA